MEKFYVDSEGNKIYIPDITIGKDTKDRTEIPLYEKNKYHKDPSIISPNHDDHTTPEMQDPKDILDKLPPALNGLSIEEAAKYIPYDPDKCVPINIGDTMGKSLLKNLCVPSTTHAYSVAVEFFKKYILDKFEPGYFKTVYVDGKHLFDDFANINEIELIKRGKPAIAFIPSLDVDFNRDGIDVNISDLTYYARTADYRDSFFKDRERNFYIGLNMELMLMNFTVRVKVNTKAKQLDLQKYMKIAYKVGATSGFYLDMDMHVPYDMLMDLAYKVGFEVDYKNVEIKEPHKFLAYLNSKSDVAFVYKHRRINNRGEFFLRARNMYTHISIPDLNIDDGERQGQVTSNFFIEFNATMRIPAPKLYVYYAANRAQFIEHIGKSGDIKSYIVNFSNIPSINSKGWEQFITSTYQEKDKSDVLSIDLKELLAEDLYLTQLIEYNKSIYMSPSAILDFKIFNNNIQYDCNIDWDTLIVSTTKPVEHELSELVIYLNKELANTQTLTMENTDYRVKYTTSVPNNSRPYKRE